ncbi:MAG: 2-oxo acid dehydrogenase subunit E2, partial [Planctomycetes bacterium]|nr:2-oxo acid dehydrogenase subunit E2 [Planctomycetota bacterium]
STRSDARTGVRAAPSVRRKARELGVDLASVVGSGPGGRVLMNDLKQPATTSQQTVAPGTRIKLKGLRRRIAEHMVHSKQTIPHYSYIDECNVTELVRLRESLKPTFAESGLKLTYLPFIVKATVAALREFPIVNASLDDEAEEIVLHDRYNLGIAVATADGLIVPVIHDADQKDLAHIVREIDRLSSEARERKSKLEDLSGGTFTITSTGGIGGLISTPVINHPEAAILGVGKVIRRPIYDAEGEIQPADLMYLSFSFDHRVLDGAVGAQFASSIIRHLENPEPLLLPETL